MLRKTIISAGFAIIIYLVFFSMRQFAVAQEEFPVELFGLDAAGGDETGQDPWHEGIYASHYGAIKGKKYYGCLGNLLKPKEEYFVALPAKEDSLDCMDGQLRSRVDDDTAAFRVIEIRLHGEDGPVFEATVEDVGPWYCGDDTYWVTDTRPEAEDGEDAKGRQTNKAGIDLSYRLAKDLGINGMGQVDWRFKKIDGEYVYVEKETQFR
jgi:hypothetical protein